MLMPLNQPGTQGRVEPVLICNLSPAVRNSALVTCIFHKIILYISDRFRIANLANPWKAADSDSSLGPLPPMGEPGLSSRLLVLVWSSPGHCGVWGVIQPMENCCPSLPLSLPCSFSLCTSEKTKAKELTRTFFCLMFSMLWAYPGMGWWSSSWPCAEMCLCLQYLAEAGWTAEGRVVGVTQPRRVAAVTVSCLSVSSISMS